MIIQWSLFKVDELEELGVYSTLAEPRDDTLDRALDDNLGFVFRTWHIKGRNVVCLVKPGVVCFWNFYISSGISIPLGFIPLSGVFIWAVLWLCF